MFVPTQHEVSLLGNLLQSDLTSDSIDNIQHGHGHRRPKIALPLDKLEPEEHEAGDLQQKE